jgi:hypothetical protein
MTENYEGRMWGQNTALWAIVAIIIVIAFLWFCHKQGEDKANLAGSIQQLYGRVNAIEPAVTANAQNVFQMKGTVAGIIQGVQDIKDDVVGLDAAVFTSRCGCGRNGGCNDTRYVAKNSYNLATSTLEQIETCGGC